MTRRSTRTRVGGVWSKQGRPAPLERDLGCRAGVDGVHFLSVDPGDMDTPLHAAAVPDADTALLKRPETAAVELADLIAAALAGSEPVGHQCAGTVGEGGGS